MRSLAFFALLGASIIDQWDKAHADNLNVERGRDQRVFFTPLIESGKFEKARDNAEVHLEGATDIKSFAGYFTVNEKYNSNLFTWYFPAQADSENAPVILWLQGGPGQSTFYGIFSEHGPFTVDSQQKLQKRITSWNNNHNMIYIDSPVGTGFSFTDDPTGYVTNALSAAGDLLIMLIQFFQLFPELQQNDFFIAGESYGGKYTSYLAYAIREFNKNTPVKINLKGFSIGNGFTDPVHQLNFSTYLYWTGLLDFRERDELRVIEDRTVNFIKQGNFYEAFWSYSKVQNFITQKSGFKNRYNYLHTKDTVDVEDWVTWAHLEEVALALHVNSTQFQEVNWNVYSLFMNDFLQSAAHLFPDLVKEYRVLLYNGHLDILVAHQFTESFIFNTKWDGVEEFKTARRKLWWCRNELAGYSKTYGNLTHVLVRNAGHMVPADQPEWAFDMITRFTRDRPIGADSHD